MKLYTYVERGQHRIASETEDGRLVDLLAASNGDSVLFGSMLELIGGGERALDAARELTRKAPEHALRDLRDVVLAAPLPRPPKIRGFSVFERHGRQAMEGIARRLSAAAPDPEAAFRKQMSALTFPPGWAALPGYYYMDATTVAGSGARVQWPSYSQWIDYELELAAVIGTGGKDIKREDAQKHIFGYTVLNDLSARDAQLQAMATGLGPGKGKDFDNSNLMGPCIVTADEIPDPYAIMVQVRVNGNLWSTSDGAEARFRFDECIAHVSRSQTLAPGELFSTGTFPDCSSVEIGKSVSRGDKIEFLVSGIGVLETSID